MNKALRWSVPFLVSLITYVGSLTAQDLHYTNYGFAPMYLNPGLTGAFHGTIRAGAVYREQFAPFIIEAFQTPMLGLDANIRLPFQKKDWFGVGGTFYGDRAGDLGWQNLGVLTGLTYHRAFDEKYKNILSLGVQFGYISQSFMDHNQAKFGDADAAGSVDFDLINHFSGSYQDVNAGITFRSNTKTSNFVIGFAIYHLTEPEVSFNDMHRSIVPSRLNAHASYRFEATEKWSWEPVIYYSTASEATDMSVQWRGHYALTKASSNSRGRRVKEEPFGELMLGLGYRMDDAIEILAGFSTDLWEAGISYDLTVSAAAEHTNYSGGFEVAYRRIFKIHPKPKIIPEIICPRL